jgi:hypothetical protein
MPAGFGLRPVLHRLRGVKIGDDVYIDDNFPQTIKIHHCAAIATRCALIGHTKGPGKIVVEKGGLLLVRGSVIILPGRPNIDDRRRCCCFSEIYSVKRCSCLHPDGASRNQAYGSITVPFRQARTIEQLRRGVDRSWRKTRTAGLTNPSAQIRAWVD